MPGAKPRMIVASLCLLSLAACDKYFDRRDQVTFGSGDAIAANKALQIIDPWPRAAQTIEQGGSGERAAAAIEKLRRRSAAPDDTAAGPTAPLTSAPAAPKF